MLFHYFESKEARRAFGGSAFIEIQYCKLKPSASTRKIVSLRSLPFWEIDGLYIYVDDMECFLSNYAEIFDNIDEFGTNYYSPSQLNEIIRKIKERKPLDYEVLLEWLKQGINHNGIYILGI